MIQWVDAYFLGLLNVGKHVERREKMGDNISPYGCPSRHRGIVQVLSDTSHLKP